MATTSMSSTVRKVRVFVLVIIVVFVAADESVASPLTSSSSSSSLEQHRGLDDQHKPNEQKRNV